MAVKSGFFMSVNGDRRYDASFFAEYFSSFIGNGVFPNPSTNLQVVEGNNMQTVVKSGKGWINGYYVHNDSDFILQHDVADGVLKRIDRVVLQWNYLTRQIVIVLKKGALASSPVAPVLVRNTDYYELALADVLISNGITRITQAAITDQRLNSALCGVVTQTVKTVDTTTLFNQYQSWINQEKIRFENDVNGWLANEQLDFETWRTSAEQSFNLWMQQEQTDFRAWYQSLQDLLDENIAATLTSKVTFLEQETSGIKQDLTTHSAENASTTVKGHVQLSDSTTSTSTSLAATANAVKKVKDTLDTHATEKATPTKLGHVKAKTSEDGTLILPEIKVDDETVFLNEYGELTTKHPPIEYYNAGNEFIDITGGFVTGYTFGTPNGVITKESTHLQIDNKGGTNNEWSVESNNKIDLKKINKLYVEWECPAPNSGSAHLMITDVKKKSGPIAQTVISGGNIPFGRRITELDTTNFSDYYYIAIKKLGGNLLKIYKIWGEE